MSVETAQGATVPTENSQAEPMLGAADLKNLVATGGAPAAPATDGGAQAPQTFGDIPADQFARALEQATGGKVKAIDQIHTLLDQSSRVPDYERKIQEYEAKMKVDPYHSDLSKRVDILLREGKTPAEVLRFVELAALEVDKLEPLDAARRHISMTRPDLTPEEVHAELVDRLGFDPGDLEDGMTPAQSAKLKGLAGQAREFLQNQRVSFDNPKAQEEANARQAHASHIVNTWREVVPSLQADLSVPEFEVEGLGKYSMSYKPSTEAVETARQELLNVIQSNPFAFPPNQQGAQEARQLFHRILVLADLDSFTQAIARDALASMRQHEVQRVSGSGAPLERPAAPSQAVPNQQKPPISYIRD